MPRVATTSELDDVIRDFVDRLRHEIRVEAVLLYGSYAYGHPHEWSDIDVAVISPDFEGVRMPQRLKTVARLMAGADPRLMALAFSSSEYHHPPAASFLPEILRTGKVLHQAPSEKSRGPGAGARYPRSRI
jgi:predicted nucleotidyltransferase